MTKDEAHKRFIKWIEAHPSDEYTIISGLDESILAYSASAAKHNGYEFVFSSCIFKFDKESK